MAKSGKNSIKANRRKSAPKSNLKEPFSSVAKISDLLSEAKQIGLSPSSLFFTVKNVQEDLDDTNDCIKAAATVLDYVSSWQGRVDEGTNSMVCTGIANALSVVGDAIDLQLKKLEVLRQEEKNWNRQSA